MKLSALKEGHHLWLPSLKSEKLPGNGQQKPLGWERPWKWNSVAADLKQKEAVG